MITKLSPEALASLPSIRDKWITNGLRTCTATDRDSAWEGIKKAYRIAGREEPALCIWMESPYKALIACSVLAQVSDQVSAQVLAQVSAQVSAQVRAQVRDQVSDQVSAQVRDQVSAQVSDQVSDFWRWWLIGAFYDSGWLSFYDSLKDHCDLDKLEGLVEVAQSASFAWTFPNIVVFSASPAIPITRDDQNRLHNLNRAAVEFGDGWGVYAIHGIRVPSDIITDPSSITKDRIEKEPNAEIRRVMMDKFGVARYLRESNSKKVHADDFGILWAKNIPDDEPLVMVEVINSTPEHDGVLSRDEALVRFSKNSPVCHDGMMIPLCQAPESLRFKEYFLRVPPNMQRAKEAVAWTFDRKEAEYNPLFQS